MSGLASLQQRFMAEIFDERPAPDPRIEIYRRNVAGALHGALAAAYPVVRRLVGDAFFGEAARRFALAVPSRAGDLHRFGAELADFLEAYPHAATIPCLPDVARLEWAIHEAAGAADAPPFDYSGLARVEPAAYDALRFHLHPSARLVRSAHPVVRIWHANQPACDGCVEDVDAGESALVFRAAEGVAAEAIEPAAWELLRRLDAGEPLAAAMEALEGTGIRLEPVLAAWCRDNVLAGFELSASTG